jgi:fumarate reductase subunit D
MNKSILIGGLVGVLIMSLLFWLGGYDFDNRGANTVFWFIMSFITAIIFGLIGDGLE